MTAVTQVERLDADLPPGVFTLSFDDGPSSEWTPAILDLLAHHRKRAMFFVTGSYLYGRSAIVERMHSDGHTIGVHGYSHKRLTTLPNREVRLELKVTQDLVQHQVGVRPSLFRAPFFDADERVLAIAADLGLTHVDANLVPEDWMALDPVALAGVVLDELRPGSVVSLHDGVPPDGGSTNCTQDRLVTVDAVRLILEGMRA